MALHALHKRMEALSALRSLTLRSWQTRLYDVVTNDTSDRSVFWIYSIKGGVGKSVFAKYLSAYHTTLVLNTGKSADIAYTYDYQDYVIFDLPRSYNNDINYSVIESIKNGVLFSSKYVS